MKNRTIRPLKNMPYAQARIIEDYNEEGLPVIRLLSYNTIAVEIIGGWLRVHGLYSATTRKHIGAFMREVTLDLSYHNAKACYEGNYIMNIYTGEVVELQ